AAVDAQIFVFDHQALRLRERPRREERLLRVRRRRAQALPDVALLAVRRDGEARERAHVDAGVALDAQRVGEDGLNVAIEAALDLARDLLGGEAQLHLDVELPETLRELDVAHLLALRRIVVVGVAPLVDAHLRAGQRHPRRRARV